MPGPQLTQAVDVCERVRAALPHVPIVWGGYFPTQHADTVLASSFVDFVVRSQGEQPLLALVEALRTGGVAGRRRAACRGRTAAAWSTTRSGRSCRSTICPSCRTAASRWRTTSTGTTSARAPSRTTRRSAVRSPAASARSSRCRTGAGSRSVRRAWIAWSGTWCATYGVDAVQMHDMDFFISEVAHRGVQRAHRAARDRLVGARPCRHADVVLRTAPGG